MEVPDDNLGVAQLLRKLEEENALLASEIKSVQTVDDEFIERILKEKSTQLTRLKRLFLFGLVVV
jgi:hypothetical protein